MRNLTQAAVATGVIFTVSVGQSTAQDCMVASTMISAAGTQVQVLKTLSNSYTCALTMMNASFCTPTTAGAFTNFLQATAMTATVAPECVWDCGPCTARIDGSDGLPVELLEFEIAK